jgi:aconitase B
MSPPRKIPTRAELLRMQKLYRTDKKIAEVLGNGVTEHLVGYWRRKKGIARHTFPKFSEKEIRELWDRFGDDFRAGMEIGISKAAFYNWRRRYKITKKPEALKLEQLSLELHTPGEKPRRAPGGGRQTVAQKILALRVDRDGVSVGEEVQIEPDVVLAPADSAPVVRKFIDSGTTYVWNPNRVVMPLDGSVAATAGEAAELFKTVRDFARRQQLRNFFEIGEGSPPQVVVEKGLILPGHLGVGCEPRAFSMGSIGALSLSVSPDFMSCLWADGRVNLIVPESVRVFVTGKTPRGVFARDIVHDIIARLKDTGVALDRIVEFYGIGVERMSISERMTLCHAAVPVSAAAAFCAFDATTRRYINPRARRGFAPMMADRNAVYAD